ncbi:MAG: HPr(Ser) kinase/phosphatase [Ruminococcus sp.]|jgi:HPr(ser) kinase/phosphatase|nr:HPr(Ser) kinase/phosphatase [Ruminococcus sp.]MDD7671043.1 HPr(Ser) kinase/phosphatase [Ruminococcus sp.]MDY2743409.1 HPr(Ser) kinase/phosphatase [Eubacteriales bacterium]CDD03546.1 hPr kinase/phosphorylase [Ruminococcus sp. CAG:382]
MQYQVKLKDIANEFSLEVITVPENYDDIYVRRADVSRPGLPLAGFFDDFESGRIQMIGNMEHSYLDSLGSAGRYESIDKFMAHDVVAVVVTRGLEIFPELKELAEKHSTPLFRTAETTSDFMASLIASLNVSLAERITRHGVLVEVYGEGVLILGDSGIGKSETAIELVKRGHRLIADDAVEIKRVSNKTLVGTAPELIRHYIELRGIGIVDVRRIFGMGSVKETEKIDLVINFEAWEQGKMYERLGLDTEYAEILGLKIPSITIPVKPGRNLAVVIEIAAMNNRQKKMGYNTALEFSKKMMNNGINLR